MRRVLPTDPRCRTGARPEGNRTTVELERLPEFCQPPRVAASEAPNAVNQARISHVSLRLTSRRPTAASGDACPDGPASTRTAGTVLEPLQAGPKGGVQERTE